MGGLTASLVTMRKLPVFVTVLGSLFASGQETEGMKLAKPAVR